MSDERAHTGPTSLAPDGTSLQAEIQRLRTEYEQVRHRLAQLDTLLEVLPVGIFIAHDPSCRSMTMNPAGAAMLGVASDTNPSKTGPSADGLRFRVFQNDVEMRAEDLPMQRAGRLGIEVAGEVMDIVRGDGSRVTLYEYASPLLDASGAVEGVLGAFVDITSHRRAEDGRRAAEELLGFIAENIPSLFSYIDRDLRYRLNNRAYETWFRRSRDEIVGKHVWEVLGEAAFERLRPYMEAALAGERVTYEGEVAYSSAGRRWIHASYSPHRGPDGEVLGFAVLVNDITALKDVEAALRRSEERLREMDRRKDEFLATLSHELRNPLAPLVNALEILRRKPDDREVVEKVGEIMERQVRQLARLVDDLLDVSRVTRGKIALRTEPVELAVVVASAIETVQPLVDAMSHHLTVSLPEEALWVDADTVRLSQIVSNLLGNACKYTPPGGEIALRCASSGPDVVLSVRDNGIGIAPDLLPCVFEMFRQLEPVAATTHGGLGVGLTLVQRLVELHGGKVDVRSDGPGHGSEFIVHLPGCATPVAGTGGSRPHVQ